MSLTVGDTSVFSGKIYAQSAELAGPTSLTPKSMSNGTTPYTVLSTDSFLVFDTNSMIVGGRTIDLPSEPNGMLLRVANVLGSNSKKITISNTVNGSTDFKIFNNEIAEFYLYDGNWVLINLFYKENIVFNLNTTLVISDETTVVSNTPLQSSWTHTLPSADDFSPNKTLNIKNIGSGSLTVTPAGSDTIDNSSSSIPLTAKKSATLKTIYDSGSSTYKWYLI
jgi:hypothetical protein